MPLSRLLAHTADAVRAVRAGQSLNDALAACPVEARPGTQALSFQVLRSLGRAQALRQRLARRPPPAWVDALLLCALGLLWDATAVPSLASLPARYSISAMLMWPPSSPICKPSRRANEKYHHVNWGHWPDLLF